MRIAFHSPRARYLDSSRAGGDSVYVNNLLDAFRRRGHEVLIVSKLEWRDLWRGSLSLMDLLKEAISVRRRIRAFSPDAWLIYTPSVLYPDLFGWWLRPKRYVLMFADSGDPRRLPLGWRTLLSYAHNRSLARADEITVFRTKSAKRLQKAGVKPDRIHILPPSPRNWEHLPSRAEARQRLGLPEEGMIALSLCVFPDPKKKEGKTEMVLSLLSALASCTNTEVSLVLVGDDGKGQFLVEQKILQLKLDKRVRLINSAERLRLIGSQDNEDVKWFFAACDFYVYPHTLDRPFLSVVEAQSCGRPVLVMDTDSMRNIVDDGQTGFLASNLDEFCVHMAKLAGDPKLCDEMGVKARAHIDKNLSLKRIVDRLEVFMGQEEIKS